MSGRSDSLRVGTRGSLLAQAQTGQFVERLQSVHPGLHIETVLIQTTGDVRADVPFAAVGTKGMFVKEIEQALLDGTIDVGVHSLKDMPSELPDGLILGCIPEREDPRDALLSRNELLLDDLPQGAVVGTGSLRRQAQIRAWRPDLQMRDLRGNLDTRIRKLDDGDYDAIVLAGAGLHRLGLANRITEYLEPGFCTPAVGQGALALEIREGDTRTLEFLEPLNHPDTEDAIRAERAFLARLGGGCSVPAGAFAQVNSGSLAILAVLAAPDGSIVLRDAVVDIRYAAEAVGRGIAECLLEAGGDAILKGLPPA